MSERFPYSFGKYRVEAEIGRGGFGNVYRAVDTTLERPIALKVLDPIYMRDRSWINRFRREAIVMAQLDHPHIVPIYDTGEIDGRLYLAMKLVDGPNLAEVLERRGRLPWEEALALVRQIADALDYAHEKDVLHRDLKPANVLLEEERALLTDFGLARLVGSNTMSMSTHGGIAGTYQYMAPELFDDEQPQRATDVYALGCILYEALTGDVLFDAGSTAAIISAHLRPLELPEETFAGDVPSGLADVLHIALAKEPNARYQSGAELVAALENVESDRLAEPYAALEQAVARGKRSIPTWVWGIGGVLALALFIWGGGALFGGDDVTPTADRDDEIANRPTTTATGTATATNTPASTAMPTTQPTATPDRNLPPADADLGDTWTRPTDEMVMVYVPAGSFQMGSDDGDSDEQPVHSVTLDAFWLDRTEVTNAQYEMCVDDGACAESAYADDSTYNGGDYPLVGVAWYDADDYCTWAGAQLPTEAQWEYAARGPDGPTYPWGNASPNCSLLQYGSCDGRTVPVGSYPDGASWVGALDMAGNVWEWVQDWYERDYYADSPVEDPPGPASGDQKVLRGGSWFNSSYSVRASFRIGDEPTFRDVNYGFRCAQE